MTLMFLYKREYKKGDIYMTKINFNPNPASVLARSLDAKDGKQDGKINASVWNDFVKDKGGKTIKYSISVENAQKSISTYLSRNSKEAGKTKATLSFEWMMEDFTKGKKPLKGNELNPNLLKGLETNQKDPKIIKGYADMITKFMTGKSEQMGVFTKDNAAQILHQVSKNLKGKIPLTLGTHLFIGSLYPTLLKQANDLGIKTNYNKDTDFGKDMKEICQNKLKACIELKNQILAAEKAKQKNT